MKISFEEGKLKELVYQNKNNKKWEELSHKLNVPIHVIKGWASERNLISKEAYELLDPRKRFYPSRTRSSHRHYCGVYKHGSSFFADRRENHCARPGTDQTSADAVPCEVA